MIKISKKNIIYNDTLIDSMFIAHFNMNVDLARKRLREFDKYMDCIKEFNALVSDNTYSIYVATEKLNGDQQEWISMKCADPIKFVSKRTIRKFHEDNKDVDYGAHIVSDALKYMYVSKEYFFITNPIGNDMIVIVEN